MVSIKTFFFSIAVCLSPIAALSDSGSLQGEDVPEFNEAVQAWLDGDDLVALQNLAGQAQQGNTAAQILLASIASGSKYHSHVTTDMERKERIALLRKPGGLSGKSWLTEAQNSEALALALLQASKIGEKAPAIATLIELGEPQTAIIAAQSMLLNGEAEELVSVLQGLDDKLPEEADVLLAWALFQASQGSDSPYAGSASVPRTLTGNEHFRLSEFAWGHLSPRALVEDGEAREAAIKHSGNIRAWTPVRNFCEDQCPDSISECTATGGSYLTTPLSPRSPLESVISNEVYWASKRVTGDLARSTWEIIVEADSDAKVPDACFKRSMKELQLVEGHG
ncbi:hypothetical protein [Ruegeria faecimaris]|uniref:HEAT repeat-containing protein n=1 Tax=Ruegeria faecimaris TaxID=686389 RepID=A0A521DZK2_9RHOB|nr:hypothetical protein [Ruegeria faecimaris]SMO77045.1 hypothetical protein SAMN06265380_10888 [Ruegeria faecimaris]